MRDLGFTQLFFIIDSSSDYLVRRLKQICKKKQNWNTIRILWYPTFKANSDVRVFDLAVGEGVVWALSLNSRIYRLHSLSPHLTTGNFWTQIDHKLIAISVDSTTDNRLWGLDTENRIVRHEVITHHLNWKILFYDVMRILKNPDIFLNKSSNSYLILQKSLQMNVYPDKNLTENDD